MDWEVVEEVKTGEQTQKGTQYFQVLIIHAEIVKKGSVQLDSQVSDQQIHSRGYKPLMQEH